VLLVPRSYGRVDPGGAQMSQKGDGSPSPSPSRQGGESRSAPDCELSTLAGALVVAGPANPVP